MGLVVIVFWCGLLLGAYLVGFLVGFFGLAFFWGLLVIFLVGLFGGAFWWGFIVAVIGGACCYSFLVWPFVGGLL